MKKKEIKNTKNTNNDLVLFTEEICAAIKRFHEADAGNRCVILSANDGERGAVTTVGTLAQILDNVAAILMHIHNQKGVDWITLRAAMIVAIDYIEKKEKEIAPPIKIPFSNTKPS